MEAILFYINIMIGGTMRIYLLFELFLIIFTLYAILNYNGSKAVLVSVICLGTAYLFEQFRKKPPKEVEKIKRRPLKPQTPRIQIQEFERTGQPDKWED